jgi:succinyl-diaminopimelate desuccinylase
LSATLRVAGTQGHVAYPERVANSIHLALPALQALCTTRWDQCNAAFPPTSLQITEVRAWVGADNVVPGETHGPV